MEVNWAICRPVRPVTPAVAGLTVPFLFTHVVRFKQAAASGPATHGLVSGAVRPPRLVL